MICCACKGQKKVWGIGMMSKHICKYCNGTGKQIEETPKTIAEKEIENAVREVVKEQVLNEFKEANKAVKQDVVDASIEKPVAAVKAPAKRKSRAKKR